MNKEERIKYLVEELGKANQAYYQENREIMSNYEYDKLYDELLALEVETGYTPDNSPTKNVGYQLMSELKKVTHEYPALSLDKTKDANELIKWLGDNEGVLSWKLDGLTVQATYDNGELTIAVTRGNGEIGEDISHNALYFKGLPKKIPYTGHLVVRGEALITYETFEKINQNLEPDDQYKNPRNLASGSVRQLDSKLAAARGIEFRAFELVNSEMVELSAMSQTFEWLMSQGFFVVDYNKVKAEDLLDTIESMEKKITENNFPSDGLVLSIDDIAYGRSLGKTGKFPRHSIAFKWQDDTVETTLREVVWQASRTGLINPVAIFDPVELEGTTVGRATAFNVSTVERLRLAPGSVLSVYKANKIIPNILENVQPAGSVSIPNKCPVCGEKAEIHEKMNKDQLVKTLHCTNPDCAAKNVGKFVHFTKRDAMNITGVSEATIEKLIDVGYIKEFSDFYHLDRFKDNIVTMEGFGEKSYQKIIKSAEKSREVKFENFLYALGIPNVGTGTSKRISKVLKGSIKMFCDRLSEGIGFEDAEDVGDVINESIRVWNERLEKQLEKTGTNEFLNLLHEVKILEIEADEGSETEKILNNQVFVVTGTLEHFENRKALEKKIEELGGKISGSVSKKTSYLINNDSKSESSKNKKAMELGVPILTEDDFLNLIKN
jgi:DNA ligase (NAD+)